MINTVIFDMDGVLFDTENQKRKVWDEVGHLFTGHPMGKDLYPILGQNRAQSVEYFRKTYGPDFSYENFVNYTDRILLEQKKKYGMPLKKGAAEILAWLRDNRYKTALATGTARDITNQNLELAGFSDYFDVIITGDMVKKAKPDPEIYQIALRETGASSKEAIVIEDSINGILAASAAGIRGVWIPDLQKDGSKIEGKYWRKMNDLIELRNFLSSNLTHVERPSDR